MHFGDIVPYTCVFLDATWRDFFSAGRRCVFSKTDRKEITENLRKLWVSQEVSDFISTVSATAGNDQIQPSSDNTAGYVLPCLSVRTALDLYLRIKNFPPGSEVIMSAINIPDMSQIIEHHKLKIIPLDIDLDTIAPKVAHLESLVSSKTVALLLAHIYGKWFDVEPFSLFAARHNIALIEDCAEVFCGFQRLGHPKADLTMFSFGVIKYNTSFGGAIALTHNRSTYQAMQDLYDTYPLQPHSEYFYKVVKYFFVYLLLNCPRITKSGMYLTRYLNIDHKKYVVKMLRSFPNGLISRLRHQPCIALLEMMHLRQSTFSKEDFDQAKLKGDYVNERLPENIGRVGRKALINNYWLFPIIVDNPDGVVSSLNSMGVDAYRGATQLNLVESNAHTTDLNQENSSNQQNDINSSPPNHMEPLEAKYLIDHVVYIPVNKTVPFDMLDKVCKAVRVAVNGFSEEKAFPSLQSKL